MGNQVHLFVEILNKYLYFFDRGCPSITVKYLKGLIRLINEHIPNLDSSDTSRVARMHYHNTLAHVKEKQAAGDDLAGRYAEIDEEDDFAASSEGTPTKVDKSGSGSGEGTTEGESGETGDE